MFFEDLNYNKKDYIYLILVFAFSIFTMYEMIEFYLAGGLYQPDKAIYLIDALKFAGLDYYNVCLPGDVYYTPVICFLTSLLFRLGFVNEFSLYFVTSIFGLFAELGLYILLRYRFNSTLSFTGAILFASLPLVLWNIGGGLIDMPSIAVSIWIIIFMVLAVNKNPKYYLIIFPLFVFGFFTRYTGGFILPVIIIYYIISKDILSKLADFSSNQLIGYLKSDEMKYILISLSLGLILALIICYFILSNGGELTFFQMTSNTIDGTKFNPLASDANNSRLYYLKNILTVLFFEEHYFYDILAYMATAIMGIGVLLKIKHNFNSIKNYGLNCVNKNLQKGLYLVFVLSIFGVIAGFAFLRNHIVSNSCLLIAMIILYYIIADDNEDNTHLKFTILNLSWLGITFIFASLYNIKVSRYFIPVLPSLVYFFIWALEEIVYSWKGIMEKSDVKFNNQNYYKIAVNIIPIILVLALIATTCLYIVPLSEIRENHDTALINVTDYIVANDPDYHSKEIIAYPSHFMIIKWYININGTKLRHFETEKIDDLNASYVIIPHKYDFKNYHEIYKSKKIHLYAHN